MGTAGVDCRGCDSAFLIAKGTNSSHASVKQGGHSAVSGHVGSVCRSWTSLSSDIHTTFVCPAMSLQSSAHPDIDASMSDNQTSTGAYKHAGHRESYRPETDQESDTPDVRDGFAGIVCIMGEEGPLERTTMMGLAAPGPCEWGEGSDGGCYSRAGAELWRTDGTGAGTRRVDDLRPGIRGSAPTFLTVFDDALFFAARTDVTGTELFRRDESSGSTTIVEASSVYPRLALSCTVSCNSILHRAHQW